MRWRKTFIAEVTERLLSLGYRGCPVCGASDSILVHRLPVLLICGDFPPAMGGGPIAKDPDRQMGFAVRIECGLCGHMMLFNAQNYRGGDEQVLVAGLTDEEEDALPDT